MLDLSFLFISSTSLIMNCGIDLIKSNKFMDGRHSATPADSSVISTNSFSLDSSSFFTAVFGMIS